jgi:PHD/YefM family antitoxin component YafN of YafNO toxin-antitoxin module
METVSVTEFRSNIKRYLDIARDEELVIYRSKNESFVVTPLNKISKEISLLSPAQKKAIDEALEDVANGRVHSHQYVMEETKKRFPHLFNR